MEIKELDKKILFFSIYLMQYCIFFNEANKFQNPVKSTVDLIKCQGKEMLRKR